MPIAFGSTNGFSPTDLGTDEDLARRILIRARQIAPCMAAWPEDLDTRRDALAILKGVYARAAMIGTGAVASQGRNGTNISFRQVSSAFTDEDVALLSSLCSESPTPAPGLPLGSFPTDRPLSKLWPEEYS